MMFGFGPAFADLIRSSRSDDGRGVLEGAETRAARLNQHCGEELEHLYSDWAQVFDRLDQADGQADGRIDRRALVKWVSALDLQKTIELEANLNISPHQLERLVSRVDQNKDGFVDKCEFLSLVANRDKELSRKQQSMLHQYLQVAAYAEEYSCWPPPLFIPCLTALQLAIYVYHIVHFMTHPDHAGSSRITWTGPEPTCSQLIFDPSRRYEFWRFLSYCLVHAGVQHILLNMLMQLFVGLPLEASHGALRVALVYTTGVVAGSLGTSTLDPNVFLAGASGGVYALISAHLATLILNWQEDIVIMRKRFRAGKATSAKHGHIVRIMRLTTVLLYGVVDTGAAIYNRHIREGGDAVKTSYVAHFCGAIAGLLIGIIVLKNRKVEHWERKLKVICVVVFLFLLILAVVWNFVGNNVTSIAYGGNATYFLDRNSSLHESSCHNYI